MRVEDVKRKLSHDGFVRSTIQLANDKLEYRIARSDTRTQGGP